ncbi:MAG: GPW/gp25 family protein [Chitinophagaceae bacterium]|nr:GPW/gp25 family protein [Chitinophagaceae bacterium]
MQLEYFSLPLALGQIMQQKEHPRVTLAQSIKQHLRMLITTSFGEFSADENFGSAIWDYDFDNGTSVHKVKEAIRQSLLQSISQNEKRLVNTKVDLNIFQEEVRFGKGQNLKKRINVFIAGTILLTNEPFTFRDSFFAGPLSY